MLPIITEGETQGDYRCIPKVSKQLSDLLSAVTGLDYVAIGYIFQFHCMKYKFLMRCLLDFRDLICITTSKTRI